MKYNFPVKDFYLAREVIEPDFDISQYESRLYVDLSPARISKITEDYRKSIKTALNVDSRSNRINRRTATTHYKKILFTGFRGTGKTTELQKIQKELTGPSAYYTVFVALESELEMTNFHYEDFFIMLILKLARNINKDDKLKHNAHFLDSIIEDWISEKEVIKEIEKEAKMQGEVSTGGGFNLLNFFKTDFNIKSALAFGTKAATKIRKNIKDNLNQVIEKFNKALEEIRPTISKNKRGKDILFIIDGLEKAPYLEYEKLIVKNAHAIFDINAHILTTVPINAQYLAEIWAEQSKFEIFIFPVIKVDNFYNRLLMTEVITRRIDKETFFDNKIIKRKVGNEYLENYEVLDYIVRMSGGVLRQLFHIVRYVLLYSVEEKLTTAKAKDLLRDYGRRMYETLNSNQKKILEEFKEGKRDLTPADKDDGILLFNLFILKYNDSFYLNPLIEQFIK